MGKIPIPSGEAQKSLEKAKHKTAKKQSVDPKLKNSTPKDPREVGYSEQHLRACVQLLPHLTLGNALSDT